MRQYLDNGRKLHNYTLSIGIKIDDLELLLVRIFGEFCGIS